MFGVEAVIVAGGLGSRLLPLTERRPKHLLPVGGVPFVTHQLAKLAAAGVDRVVLATSYHADQFEPMLGDGRHWGLDLVYAFEAEPLGTAGAIRRAADELRSAADDPVVILNGDILSGHDLVGQLRQHVATTAGVTLHLVEVPDARPYGCVPTDGDGRVRAFLEKAEQPVSNQINAGCYVFTRRIIDLIPPGRVVSVERETFPSLLAEGQRVMAWVDPSYWMDVGTPAALIRASVDLVAGVMVSPATPRPAADAWVDPAAVVDPDAVLRGGSTVGPGARIGAGARIEGSVLDAGVMVGAGAVVRDSALGLSVEVGARARLSAATIGDDGRIAADVTPSEGVLVPAGSSVA